MNITIIGTGYVGLVSGTCFSEFGFNVTCVDKDTNKINNLQNGIIPIYEPSLEDLVKKNMLAKRLSFSTSLSKVFKDSDAIFIAVGTPTNVNNNKADLKYIYNVIREIADLIDINDLSKYKNYDKKESPLIEELKNIWDNDEIFIIYKNLNYINDTNDDNLKRTYIKSIEDILSYKEKQVEKYINNSSTTY